MKSNFPLKTYYANNYLTIFEDELIKEAMKKVVKESTEETLIDFLYVIDRKNKLVGTLRLKDLIIAREIKKVEEVMDVNLIHLKEETPIYEAIDTIQKYDLEMVPIINKHGSLKGVFSAENALDLLKEETLEQYRNIALINENSIDASAKEKALSRLPWLIVLLALSLITSSVIGSFEDTIKAVVVLAYFQTMLLDMAGNISTQSLASIVIKLSKDPKGKMASYIRKELLIGFINSFFCAIFGFIAASAFLAIIGQPSWSVSLIVALSLFVGLIIGTLSGALVPIVFRKLKVDPSVASGPFMTTINDIFSLIVYLSLATAFLI